MYITHLFTTFDRPQLSESEGWCTVNGHEYKYEKFAFLLA